MKGQNQFSSKHSLTARNKSPKKDKKTIQLAESPDFERIEIVS